MFSNKHNKIKLKDIDNSTNYKLTFIIKAIYYAESVYYKNMIYLNTYNNSLFKSEIRCLSFVIENILRRSFSSNSSI